MFDSSAAVERGNLVTVHPPVCRLIDVGCVDHCNDLAGLSAISKRFVNDAGKNRAPIRALRV